MERNNKGRFVRKYNLNENFLNEKNKINSFFIGLMASDGNVNKNNKAFSLSQSGDNGLNLIKIIQKWLEYDGKIYSRKTTHKLAHSLTITSEKIVKKLKEHNVTPNKSFTYKYNNITLFNEFLQGYVEGDGCVGIYDSSTTKYYYISFFGNKDFKDSIINLLPIKPKLRKVNGSFYEIKFLGKNGIEFSNWLWNNPIYVDSPKYKKYVEFKENYLINTKYYKYGLLNKKINNLLNKNIEPKIIAERLKINKRTVYNYKYNKKNGKNTY